MSQQQQQDDERRRSEDEALWCDMTSDAHGL